MTVVHSKTAIELNEAPISNDWIIEGNPVARTGFLSRSRDRSAYTLIWDCTAGRFLWKYDIDETVYIQEGAVVVTPADGEPLRLQPGDVAFFPAGSQAHWHVENYVRKVAFCRSPEPTPIALLHRIYRRLLRVTKPRQSALSPA